MSGLINEYLKEYIRDDSPQRASDELEEDLKKREEELNLLRVQFSKAKEEEKRAADERMEKAKLLVQGLRAARVTDFD